MADEKQRRDLERWKRGPKGFLPKANKVIDALNELKGRPGPPRQVFRSFPKSGGGRLFLVRLSAFDATNLVYTGTKIVPNNLGGYSDASPAVTYKVFEKRGFIGAELGARVWIDPAGAWAGSASVMAVGTPIYTFEFMVPRQTFAVNLVQTGGSNGTKTTTASWTYRVENADGHILGTAMSPLCLGFRTGLGPVVAATKGLASYDDGAVLALEIAYEVHGTAACTT